jgi:hypothetical protein
MGNLIHSKKEYLVNTITGTEFSIAYSAKTGKISFLDHLNGVVIPGRPMDAAFIEATEQKDLLTTVPTLPLYIRKAAVGQTDIGTKRKITLTPIAGTLVADRCIGVYVVHVPDLSAPATPGNMLPITEYYQVNTSELETISETTVCDALRAQINANPESVVEATGTTTLILEAKDSKNLFNISSSCVSNSALWGISTLAFTAVVDVMGKKPVMTYEQMAKEFAIHRGDEGMLKDYPVNQPYVKVILEHEINGHYETVSANGLISVYDQVNYYIPKSEYNKDVFSTKIIDAAGDNSEYSATNDWHLSMTPVASGGFTLGELLEYAFAKSGSMAVV